MSSIARLTGLEPLGIRIDFPNEPTTGGDMDWIFAAPLDLAEGSSQENSPTPSCLNYPDIDLLHGHHRIEGTLCLIAASGQRFGQHARRDLPRDTPLVFAPAAVAFPSAIADYRIPVAIGLFLIVSRDLK